MDAVTRVVLACVAVSIAPVSAQADGDGRNVMIGPVLGLRLGGPAGSRAILGIEGGGGWRFARVNLGFTRRLGKTFGYIELDPWFIVGVSVGAGVDSDGKGHPVLGVWEGMPVVFPGCEEEEVSEDGRFDESWHKIITVSAGYRYTGVHELYVAPKAGSITGAICFE